MDNLYDIKTNNNIIKKFDIIEDIDMKNALLNYFIEKLNPLSKSHFKALPNYLSIYKTIKLDSLDWDNLCDITTQVESKSYYSSFGLLNFNFFVYLIENNLYKGSNSAILYEKINLCKGRKERLALFDKNTNLEDFITVYYVSKRKELFYLMDTKLNNKFLVRLLSNFYKSDLFGKDLANKNFAFGENFVYSYDNFSNFKAVTDFNYQVFDKQFNFYKDNIKELKALLKFYIYLYSLDNNIFKPTDPIDITWMKRSDFLKQYEEGFRLFNFNPIEHFPSNDKWVIRPNGQENFSTKMNSTTYYSVNFTRIHYNRYRTFAKDYFWKSTLVLPSRIAHMSYIIEFLNFIYEYKNLSISKQKHVDYMEITTQEVYSYVKYISNNNLSEGGFNNKMSVIKALLENDYFNSVSPSSFELLVQNKVDTPYGGKSIPKDELEKLDRHLLKLAQDNNNDKFYIYYAIFRLALDTNFRISQLLSITTDSIKEGMKKGQYYIEDITKTSNKEKVKENISKYAHRYLDIAVKKTTYLRENVNKDYEKYVFLYYAKSGHINEVLPISAQVFNRFLKSQCRAIDLPEYTAKHLRYTSITKILDYAEENGLSPMEIKTLVRGNVSTKIKHYFDAQESKLFVESTYGIIIGNIDIKGQILETYDSSAFDKEETVDDNCGFCKEEECILFEKIGCPMCSSFVVTLDRIPFYEEKLRQLDNEIEKETIEHEIEHTLAIKRIYAAYLAELYKHKEKLRR